LTAARAPRKPAPPSGPARRPRIEAATAWDALSLSAGDPVILYLQVPKEKVWGLLVSLGIAGVVVRCIDLAAFDDWMRQEARQDEPYLGLSTVFYPMNRVERMERDQTTGPVISYSDRFAREVGRSVRHVIGLPDPD
jgi:hypothetical protein